MLLLLIYALAIASLYCLRGTSYSVLWWSILASVVLMYWTAATVKTATRQRAQELGLEGVELRLVPPNDVIQFWVKVNLGLSVITLLLSVAGLFLS